MSKLYLFCKKIMNQAGLFGNNGILIPGIAIA